MSYIALGDLISKAKVEKCGSRDFPVLSMTMHDGIVFQNDRFKKDIASIDRSNYSVVNHNQLVVSFPIDEGVLAVQDITEAGIVSPAYKIWNIDQERVIPKYLEIWLRSPRSIEYYKSKLRGTTARRRSIPEDDFLGMPVSIPSIAIQRYAVDLIARIRQIMQSRQEQLSTLDDLIRARFVEMFGDVKTNPYGFEKRPLKETCTVVTGNTPSRSVSEYYGDSIEWIKTDNIIAGQLNPSRANEYLSDEGAKVGRTVGKGAILMACIAGSIASIGRVCITDRGVAFNQQINAVIPKQYDSLYLYVMLQISKEYLVEEINMALKGILSKSKLENKQFIVPPMDEQKRFAMFATQIDKSKDAIKKSLAETQTLFDSLMQKYFG